MFQVLHSSAGAGKTHALVKHYLLLSLHKGDPAAYTRILALTFTNKAAAEMRERVLVYLEALASGGPLDGAKADVRDEVMRKAGIGEEELYLRARAMLTHMLHHWSQVAISTIDSFMRRVVMPFTRDLQLDHELRMTVEEEFFRAKAVDLLLEEAGQDAALTEVLVAACSQLLEEERAWKLDEPLLELSGQLGRESALEHLEQLKAISAGSFLEIRERLRKRVSDFRDHMHRLGTEALDAIAHAGIDPRDLAGGANGFIVYFRRLLDLPANGDLGKGGPAAFAKDVWHSSKASTETKEAIDALAPLFRRIIGEVEELRGGEMRDHLVRLAILRDLLSTASLHSIDQRLEQLKQMEGVSFFSDLTRKVMGIVQNEPAPFLYEKLGERYLHFLVDEFQDTSLMQWHAMLPLVENALATDGSVLLVGDAKQAIYRWRNGEARQFDAFPQVFGKEALARGSEYESALQRAFKPIEPLDANWRSGRGIIAFNNALTGHLKQTLSGPARSFYDRHEQQARRGDEGYVEVVCYPGKPSEDEPDNGPWELMVKAVQDCLDDQFRPGDIGVLVRTGKQGIEASRKLAAQGWNVVSPDGLRLGANPAAGAVVNIMAWLQHPADEHAAKAAQAIALLGADPGTVDPFPDGTGPQTFMRAWHAAHPLVRSGETLVALTCRIAEAIGHHPAKDAFIMGLVDEVHAFCKTSGDDLPGFLEHWERTASNRSIGGNPGSDAIQVMTIHKAKGLQFPVVILPEAGKTGGGKTRDRIWIDPGKAAPDLPAALVGVSKAMEELEVPEVEEEIRLRQLDDLDVLYVAITRPELRLYISVSDDPRMRLATAIREHLQLEPGGTWTSGSRVPRAPIALGHADDDRTFPLESSARTGERPLAIRCEAPEDWDPAAPDPYRSHGRAVHAILEHVRVPQDLPAAVAREAATGSLAPGQAELIGAHLAQLLAKPGLAPFFHDGAEVYTEATLLDAHGQAHRPDRVVRNGEVLHVLDIKTGAPQERHKDQVRGYMALLAEVEHCPVNGWLLYVREGELLAVDP